MSLHDKLISRQTSYFAWQISTVARHGEFLSSCNLVVKKKTKKKEKKKKEEEEASVYFHREWRDDWIIQKQGHGFFQAPYNPRICVCVRVHGRFLVITPSLKTRLPPGVRNSPLRRGLIDADDREPLKFNKHTLENASPLRKYRSRR